MTRAAQPIRHREAGSLADAIELATRPGRCVLALGIPLCPACELLDESLYAIGSARPGVRVEIARMATPEEWALRESLLWPLGIHVSRASVPVLALFVDGVVVATRQGGGPATVIDAWLGEHLGPPAHPITDLTPAEGNRLADVADLRVRHLATRAGREQ